MPVTFANGPRYARKTYFPEQDSFRLVILRLADGGLKTAVYEVTDGLIRPFPKFFFQTTSSPDVTKQRRFQTLTPTNVTERTRTTSTLAANNVNSSLWLWDT